jgi:hypothetical protein
MRELGICGKILDSTKERTATDKFEIFIIKNPYKKMLPPLLGRA